LDLFFDIIFNPKKALSNANELSLITLFILAVEGIIFINGTDVILNFYNLTLSQVRIPIITAMIAIFYPLGIAAINFLLYSGDRKYIHGMILTFFPYIFFPLFSFMGDWVYFVFIATAIWSTSLEIILNAGYINKNIKFQMISAVLLKILRVIFFLILIYVW